MKHLITPWTLCLALSPIASADTHNVHPVPGMGDFASPAEALTSPLVEAGDTVEVAPGTYAGLLLVDKAVHLVATGGPLATVLDAMGVGTVVEISVPATVEGFTIRGGGGLVLNGGVLITSTEPATLRGNVIKDNHPIGDMGIPVGGVRIDFGASAVLVGNDIRSNTSLSIGGVFADALSTFEMVGNKIRGNGGSGTITGGLLLGGSGRLVNEQITGNHGSGIGGVYVAGGMGPPPFGAPLEILSCTIYGNVGASPMGSAGGVFLDDGGAVTITNTLIHSNTGTPIADIGKSPDFSTPPAAGFVDLSYSHVGMPGSGIPLGPGVTLFGDPVLVAPAAASPTTPTITGDFRPMSFSLLVDMGLDSAFPGDLEALDHLGAARVFGDAIDKGAFEYHSEPGRMRPDRKVGLRRRP